MFIARKRIIDRWFGSLFPWLEECEKIFGFDKDSSKINLLNNFIII